MAKRTYNAVSPTRTLPASTRPPAHIRLSERAAFVRSDGGLCHHIIPIIAGKAAKFALCYRNINSAYERRSETQLEAGLVCYDCRIKAARAGLLYPPAERIPDGTR
jgi:hypothetical protein